MLYLFYGTNTDKTREEARSLVKKLEEKRPDAATISFSDETFSSDALSYYVSAAGLFAPRQIVTLSKLLTHDEYGESVLDMLSDLAESENIFILVEGTLPTKIVAACERHAEKVVHFPSKEKEGSAEKPFSIFTLTDALGRRDKKNLWVLYQRALREGISPEDVHSVLLWQVKTILMASGGATKTMKPFVVTKAKSFLKNFSRGELENLSLSLVTLYHDARRGIVEFGIGLEKLLLSI